MINNSEFDGITKQDDWPSVITNKELDELVKVSEQAVEKAVKDLASGKPFNEIFVEC